MEQVFQIMKKLSRMSPANQNNNSSRSVYVRNNILRTIILFSLFFSITVCKAQTIQWASELVRFSTETSRTQYAAKQALGPPNKLPATGESVVAWAPSTPENPNGEFIHVRFATPMHVKQIAIGENNGPGAVKEIILFSVDGEKHSVYKNENIKPEYITGGRMFRQFIPLTDYLADEVKVILNTQAIAGMNQIDCIGISDSEEPITAKINEAVYDEIIPAPENLGPNINSTADDMFAFISPDGQTLYFARKNYIENFGDAKRDDIYISHWVNNAWTKAENAGAPLNNDQHNYVSWISPDGTTLMLANNYEVVKQDISISKKTSSGWSFPKALKVNDFYNQSHFSCYHMNTEGNVILMNIERPDSKGDMDIYVSFLKPNKVWSEPKNIGNIINTVGIEASIFIASDNKTIYFSTNGKSGYGGFDMFMSKRLDDTWLNWSEPVNLGKQINTAGEEYFYTVPASGDYIYFSSTTNSYGKADLFRIKLPQPLQPDPVTLLKGKIIDADTKKEITADIEFGGLRGEESSGISTTSASDYQIIIPENNYHITIKKEGYVPSFKNYDEQLDYDDADFNSADSISVIKHQIKNDLKPELKNTSVNRDELMKTIREKVDEEFGDTSAMKEQIVEDLTKELTGNLHNDSTYEVVQENIEMSPIREGTVIRLNNIFFEANKADLKPESMSSLDELASFLMENKNIYAEIGGHTNGLPGDDFCQKLSNDRAKAVTDYLILKGVRSDHLTWKGYGKTIPLATNATVEGRKKNQRVELKIIKVD